MNFRFPKKKVLIISTQRPAEKNIQVNMYLTLTWLNTKIKNSISKLNKEQLYNLIFIRKGNVVSEKKSKIASVKPVTWWISVSLSVNRRPLKRE